MCSVGAVVGVVRVVVDLEAILQKRFGTRRARNVIKGNAYPIS